MKRSVPVHALVALAQGVYYLLTAIWPFVSPRTFQNVTGPKRDFWLVKTVGVLIGVIGGVLFSAGLRQRITPDLPLLAVGSAAGLGIIDVVYVLKGRISPVYLLDAAAEALLILGWTFLPGFSRVRIPFTGENREEILLEA